MSQTGAGRGQQIPLPFTQFEPLDFDLYLPGENQEVQIALEKTATGTESKCIYLWGDHGCGKSHLLQATCKRAAEAGITVAYVPLKLFADKPVSIIEGLGEQQLVSVDDLDTIVGQRSWEEALFHLYNELTDNCSVMLMSSLASPRVLNFSIDDLKSRLGWGLVYQLHTLSDADKIMLLKRRAHTRGFNLSNEVVEYLLAHSRRDMNSLISLLDRIDQASLAEQRKITIPFVKSLL